MKCVNDTTVHKNVKRIGLGPSKARTRNIMNRIYYFRILQRTSGSENELGSNDLVTHISKS